MKYLKIDCYADDGFDRSFSDMIREISSKTTWFYHEISKEAALSFIRNGDDSIYYEIYSSYIKLEDDEFDEFKRQFQAAVKMRHLNELVKNAE